MNFDIAVDFILAYEGDYVNDPNDPGGETNYGISKRSFPHLDIKNLSRDDAREIYKKNYWDKVEAEFLPPGTRLMAFDCAVNQGVTRAIKFVQRAVKVNDDGILGPLSKRAIENEIDADIVYRVAKFRLRSYTSNDTLWRLYGKGWSKRLVDVSIIAALWSEGKKSFGSGGIHLN